MLSILFAVIHASIKRLYGKVIYCPVCKLQDRLTRIAKCASSDAAVCTTTQSATSALPARTTQKNSDIITENAQACQAPPM